MKNASDGHQTPLDPRAQQIVDWRAQGITFTEIGRRLGVSRQRAQQIDRAAREQLSLHNSLYADAGAWIDEQGALRDEAPLEALGLGAGVARPRSAIARACGAYSDRRRSPQER